MKTNVYPMQNSPDQMSAVGAQAAISGERVAKTVTFATTGDPETDLITGIVALFQEMHRQNNPHGAVSDESAYWANDTAARACHYLAGRFSQYAEHLKRRIEENKVQAKELARIQSAIGSPSIELPCPNEYYTTSGTIPDISVEAKAAWLSRWKHEM